MPASRALDFLLTWQNESKDYFQIKNSCVNQVNILILNG